jgi:hypothetical protein
MKWKMGQRRSPDRDGATTTIEKRPPPSPERISELLIYEPGIGLRWRAARGSARAGARAGGHHHSGHARIGIDRRSYRVDLIVSLFTVNSRRISPEDEQRSAIPIAEGPKCRRSVHAHA